MTPTLYNSYYAKDDPNWTSTICEQAVPVVTYATMALGPASPAEEDQAKALIKCLAPSSAISLIMSECPSPRSIISSALRAWPMAVSATNRSSSCFDCASVDRSSAGGSGMVRTSLMRASAKRASRSHRSTKPSEPLFHGIANEDQGADRRFPRFFENMTQNFFDLGLAGADPDLAHKRGQALSARHEARCLTFGKSPVINKLNIEAAMCGRRREHASLHALRNVPGGLSAYRGIEGKNEPAPTSLGRHGQFRRSFEKTLDIRLGAGLWHDDRAFVPLADPLGSSRVELSRHL